MSYLVAIVEDDEAIRESLADILTARGHRVVQAANGELALDHFRHTGSRPSAVILDLMMPTMDGWAFLAAQRSEPLLDGVPVIVVTATDQDVGQLPATVRAVLRKPFSLPDLIDMVRHACSDLGPRLPPAGTRDPR